MSEIIPLGSNLFTQSFTRRFSSRIADELDGRSIPDSEYSFDGFRISGFSDVFGDERRYIRPSDKSLAFQFILSS